MFIRFLLVGGCGFVIDAGVTYLLVLLNLAPWLARIPAIMLAMTFTWLANRYFTYQVKTQRSADEAFRYMLVASLMAGLNYSIYLGLVKYGVLPVAAVTVATAFQTVISFRCYQFLVFGEKIVFKSWNQFFQFAIPALAILSGLIRAIDSWSSRSSLWEDEIIAITHGLQSFPLFFIEVLRNDIHPFFYFFLLKIWMLPNMGSDAWALFSSLFFVVLSALFIVYTTYRLHGRLAALWAGALFCALPNFAWAASNLRMYAVFPLVAVSCWLLNREVLRTGRLKWVIGLILLQFMQIYMHAIGFFFLAFFALAALIEKWPETDRPKLKIWIVAQLITFAGMLPVVLSALVRGTEALPMPDFLSLLSFPAQLMLPWTAITKVPWVLFAGGVVFFLYLFFALKHDKATRIQVLVIPCGALLTCIAVSLLGKPMFKSPVFVANLVPFLVIGAAAGIAHLSSSALRLLAMALVIGISLGNWFVTKNISFDGNFKTVSAYLTSHVAVGDVVIIPKPSIYWGVVRYAVSPEWGEPLNVMPLKDNDAWGKLKTKLGPQLATRLGLNPETDNVSAANGVRYFIGTDVAQNLQDSAHVWIVHCDRYKDVVSVAQPLRVDQVEHIGGDITIAKMVTDPAGSVQLANPGKP
jgi:putative flippase GtrA